MSAVSVPCTGATGTGGRQKVSADTFGDLLGSQGFHFAPKQDTGPKTINEMKKADMAKEMDPDKLKVRHTDAPMLLGTGCRDRGEARLPDARCRDRI